MMFLALLLAAQEAPAVPPRDPAAYRPAPATIVAEPVALLFAGFDRDGNGRTTRDEASAGLAAITRDGAWDAGLGYLAFADWALTYLGDRNAVPTPFEIDRDGDNRVTRAELTVRLDGMFTRLDVDKDDALTRAELLTIRAMPIRTRTDGDEGRRADRRPRR